MKKRHQVIYDNGYTQAIRDFTKEILNGEEVNQDKAVEVIKKLIKPIDEKYGLGHGF